VFRRFELPNGTKMGPRVVLDLVALDPFEGATNRTAVLVLEKGHRTEYPVKYCVWSRKGKSPAPDAHLQDVKETTSIDVQLAEPVSDNVTDVWLTAPSDCISGIKKAIGRSPYTAHAGITTWLNGVYFLDVLQKFPNGKLKVRNIGDVGKKHMTVREAIVEPDLIYVLVRGRDVSRWSYSSNQYAVIPHTAKTGWRALPEEEFMVNYPETFTYLRRFKDELDKRSGRRDLRAGHPFYILGSTGEHTFEPYKVAWGSMSRTMSAAVLEPREDLYLGTKMVMLEHSAMYLEAHSSEEAHFICALLNSAPSRAAIECFKGMGAYGNVARLVGIPSFDRDNELHIELSNLSRRAHKEASDQAALAEMEDKIDQLAADLWAIDGKELEAIRSHFT